MTTSVNITGNKKVLLLKHKPFTGRMKQKITPEISSAINVDEKNEEYVVYVAVPGMQRKDFSVNISSKLLTVAAAKKEAMHCFSPYNEQNFAKWQETFSLPEDADTVMTAAVYRNGELEIHIPKGKSTTTSTPVEVFVY